MYLQSPVDQSMPILLSRAWIYDPLGEDGNGYMLYSSSLSDNNLEGMHRFCEKVVLQKELEGKLAIVMPSSGLSGKDGMVLYAGDVVRENGEYFLLRYGSSVSQDYEPNYSHGFYFHPDISLDQELLSKNTEYVGDIYKNPELFQMTEESAIRWGT